MTEDGDLDDATLAMDGSVAIALFALGMTAGMLTLLIAFQLAPEPRDEEAAEFSAVRDFAKSHYVREIQGDELADNAFSGMLGGLDPFSRYFDEEDSESQRRSVDGDFRGIGIAFRTLRPETQILFPMKGSPAWEAGIQVGDTVLAIDGESLDGLDRQAARARFDPAGRDHLDILVRGLDGERRSLVVEPEILVDPTVRHARMLPDAPGVGYLAVLKFTGHTAEEFDAAMTQLVDRGARAVVLDLRGNRGGVLSAAVHLAGRFLGSGVVVSSEGRISREVHLADDVEALFEAIELCILTDGLSASASEVLAGALQDHRAAVIVGEPTYGKGVIQTTRAFPRFKSRAKVTSGYFYSPSHRNFDRGSDPTRDFGILPDVWVPIDEGARKVLHDWLASYDPPVEALDAMARWEQSSGEVLLPEPPEDPQLEAALALLRGEAPGPSPANARRRP